MEKTLDQLARLVSGAVEGDPDFRVRGACSPAQGAPDRITFAETPASLAAALASAAGAIVVDRTAGASGKPLIRVDRPRAGFIRILQEFSPDPQPVPGTHPTAVIDPAATLGDGVSVGPQAVVQAGAVLGDRTAVGAGAVIGQSCRTGPDCRIYPRVVLYPGVVLGARVILHAGAVLGSDGFGYMETPLGHEKFPQVGSVLVGDDVEIGAGTTIDRGTLDATRIGAGTKIDNLVQIAHNVTIGQHCMIAAQCGIAGTSTLGDWVVLGGQAGIADHVTVEARAVVGARTGILPGKVLKSGVVYWGTPGRPIGEVKERYADVGRIPRLVERMKTLEERVRALNS